MVGLGQEFECVHCGTERDSDARKTQKDESGENDRERSDQIQNDEEIHVVRRA